LKGLVLASVVGVWVWLVPLSAALAAPLGVHLEWSRPPGSTCPVKSVVESDVEDALGHQVFAPVAGAELRVHGDVDDSSSGVRVRLEARSVRGQVLGTRELQAPAGECAGLRSDIALVLTLLVEGTARVTPASPPLRIGVGAWGGLIVQTLPRLTWGLGPALTLDVGAYVQLRADAAYWLPVAIETTSGIRAALHAGSVALRVCPRIEGDEQSTLLLRLCVGAQLGALFAWQSRPEVPAPQVRMLSQALLELRGGLRVGDVGRLELSVGPTVALHRPSIVSVRSDDSRVVLFRPPSFGWIVALAFML